MVHDGHGYRALPWQGGHADFAPGTERELGLWRYLRGRYGEHVSYERVLSGNGLGDLYGFCRTAGDPEPAWLTAALAAGDRNAVIAEAALAGTDAACADALAMFVEILGAEAGNLALRGFATGGVVIGGGIPPKMGRARDRRADRALQRQGPLPRLDPDARRAGHARAARGAVRRGAPRPRAARVRSVPRADEPMTQGDRP